jgi:thioredoxin-like negative regulator of GroEL
MIREVAGGQFAPTVLHNPDPVIVLFEGERCAPCVQMKKALTALQKQFQDTSYPYDDVLKRTDFVTVSIDNPINHTICAMYGIMSVPTLLFFHRGNIVGTCSVPRALDIFNSLKLVLGG